MDTLERYILENMPPEEELLHELDRETHLSMVQPRMISGHVQGRLLKMLVQMIGARKVLEIGTFTGYSAICLGQGLGEGGVVHTIEIDDELEEVAAKYFHRAEQNMPGRIVQHVGSALEIAPKLGETFDLIFIDGDKREYPQYLRLAMECLVHEGSYILADNILWYGKVTQLPPESDRFTEGIRTFNRLVAEDPRLENVILPLRDGLNLIRVAAATPNKQPDFASRKG